MLMMILLITIIIITILLLLLLLLLLLIIIKSDIWWPRRSYPPNSQKKARRYCNIHWYNDITNNDCSCLQINLSKMRALVTELSSSTKIVLSSIILRHHKDNTIVKVNRGKEIIKQFCETNKLDLIGS